MQELPEMPYDINSVVEAIEKRGKAGKRFTIIAVAEGAISKEDAALSKKELKEKKAKKKYPSVAYELAEKIQEKTDKELLCLDIHSEAALRVHMTVCLQQDLVQKLREQFWKVILDVW